MRDISRLAALERMGLRNPMATWAIAHGMLDCFCPTCGGRGAVIASPCVYREPGIGTCTRAEGCASCRRRCPTCQGQRVLGDELLPEDFGDGEDRRWAESMFPGLQVGDGKRLDREAPALG